MCNISCSNFEIPESDKTVLDNNGVIEMLLNIKKLIYLPDQREKFSECVRVEVAGNRPKYNVTFNTLPTGQMYKSV